MRDENESNSEKLRTITLKVEDGISVFLHPEYNEKYGKEFLVTDKGTIVGELSNSKIVLYNDYCEKVIENSKDLPACVFTKDENDEIQISDETNIEDSEKNEKEKEKNNEPEAEIKDLEKEEEKEKPEVEEIAKKLNVKPEGIKSVTIINNKETMSRVYGTDAINTAKEAKIVRFGNNKTIVLNESNDILIGFESTPISMEIINELNLGKYAESTINDKHISVGKTEGTSQNFNDIIVISKYPYDGTKLVVTQGLDGKTQSQVFEYTNEGLFPAKGVKSILPTDRDVVMYAQTDRVKDIKEENTVDNIIKNPPVANRADEIKEELNRVNNEIQALKEKFDGEEVSPREMEDISNSIRDLNDKASKLKDELNGIEIINKKEENEEYGPWSSSNNRRGY